MHHGYTSNSYKEGSYLYIYENVMKDLIIFNVEIKYFNKQYKSKYND